MSVVCFIFLVNTFSPSHFWYSKYHKKQSFSTVASFRTSLFVQGSKQKETVSSCVSGYTLQSCKLVLVGSRYRFSCLLQEYFLYFLQAITAPCFYVSFSLPLENVKNIISCICTQNCEIMRVKKEQLKTHLLESKFMFLSGYKLYSTHYTRSGSKE